MKINFWSKSNSMPKCCECDQESVLKVTARPNLALAGNFCHDHIPSELLPRVDKLEKLIEKRFSGYKIS